MKSIFLFILLAISSAFQTGTGDTKEMLINIDEKRSYAIIKGTTNVSTFDCRYRLEMLDKNKKIRVKQSGNTTHFKNARLALDNKGFDCGNKTMNKDFRELLKTDRYPQVYLELKQAKKLSPNKVKAVIEITIAGVTNDYDIELEAVDSKTYKMVHCINITNFGLQPPTKMLGLVVVQEEIDIEVQIAVEVQKP